MGGGDKRLKSSSSASQTDAVSQPEDDLDDTVKFKLFQAFEDDKRLVKDVTDFFTNWMALEYQLMLMFRPNDKSIINLDK